jgi:hypothetical protein
MGATTTGSTRLRRPAISSLRSPRTIGYRRAFKIAARLISHFGWPILAVVACATAGASF